MARPKRGEFHPHLAEHRARLGLTQDQVAERLQALAREHGDGHLAVSGETVARHERGKYLPGPHYRRQYTRLYGASEEQLGLVLSSNPPPALSGQVLPATDADDAFDAFDAFELAQRAAASDVGDTVLTGLEQAADRLAVAYQGTPPAILLPEVRRHLGYIGQLLDKRATLDQRRRLLVVGGWLSLLAATVDIDLNLRPVAAARLNTATSLAEQAGHKEIVAWCLETRAWDALTERNYKLAVDLSQAAQRVAPRDGSAIIQATAQEGRAAARLGDDRQARDALARVERMASPLAVPDQPEHHFRYDPAKQLAYSATVLSWLADPAAEAYTRDVLNRLESGRDGGTRPRRVATARLDLALTLAGLGNLDEAAGQAIVALKSGRIVPSSAWRAAEIVDAVENREIAEAAELREAFDAIRHKNGHV
ncbi:hypothetical protein GCM10009557_70110 [Virgisporangium ochraceum]|uniref:Uncharacterized protein n=1 Tax=Virgisporangium ochraceum TaxID=65505 RepID=A0A8J4A7Y8_9ACTN|nr:helix-turn-helix transcriptional regulator [Virgisporangium ochraceum]GIJ75555.1 hypothetical protein Voc01_104720 [Virgisporangium ochraceum]